MSYSQPTTDKNVCCKCSGKVAEAACKVGDKVYHEACFLCESCQCPLTKSGYQQKDNKVMCQRCYAEKLLPKCSRCLLPVHQIRLQCGALLNEGKYWIIGENIYCRDDYFEAQLNEELRKDQQQ
uniref:LIM zinc-binding domain-containing protein n=1 Tax=Trichuris muris TaxID=70415 RepID=A0A5S6Q9J7_TRIMR